MIETDIVQHLKNHFAARFSQEEMDKWFSPLHFSYDQSDNTLKVAFPHMFFGQWFMQNMTPHFDEYKNNVTPSLRITYSLNGKSFSQSNTLSKTIEGEAPEIEDTAYRPENDLALATHFQFTGRIPLADHTFETFLVNKKNDFPLAAAKETVHTIKNPLYSSFTIFGQSGSGKTHLMEAMMNAIQEQYEDVRIFYGDTEELHECLKQKNAVDTIQAFFIDDILQHGENNTAHQKFFISQFDNFNRANTLVVVSMDTHPNISGGLLPKLRQRLNSGLVIELKKPDVHIRRQYMQQMNAEFALGLTSEQMLSLAQTYTDFRQIIGALTHIKAYKLLMDQETTDLDTILGSTGQKKEITCENIITHVVRHHNVTREDMLGTARDKASSLARQQAMFLCRELLGIPLAQVGQLFGGRDHSSVVYSIKKVKSLQESNKDMHNELSLLKKMCLSPVPK